MSSRSRWETCSIGCAALVLCTLAASEMAAQPSLSDPPPVEIKTLPRRFVADEWQIWTSPFRAGTYNSHAIKKYAICSYIRSFDSYGSQDRAAPP